jgi:hypothetical protein
VPKLKTGDWSSTGRDAFWVSNPLTTSLREKTLEAWVRVGDLNQRGGGSVALETPDGGRFDAITFGERQPRRWAAGSEGFARTKAPEASDETAGAGETVHVAITHAAELDAALFRNGVARADTVAAGPGSVVPSRGSADCVLDRMRATPAAAMPSSAGDRRRSVYDRALSPE